MDHSAIPSFEITAPINPGFRLIEASAGTGKTFTVGGIYLRLVIELNIPVQKILVVTFTNAATQELSTRLRDRLRDFESLLDNNGGAHSDPVFNHILTKTLVDNSREVLLERVRRALVEFDEAKICTIHGFCQRLLSDQFFLAGEFVDFVLEPSDNLAHEEYSRRCFETWVEAKPFLFLAWLRKLKYGPSRLVELLRLAEKHPLVDLHLENTNNDFPDVAAESFMKKVRVFVDGVWCNEVGKSFRNSIWRGIEEGVLNKNSYRFNAASFEERILKCEQMLCDLAQGVGIFDGEVLEKIRPSYLKSKTKKSMSLDLHGESC